MYYIIYLLHGHNFKKNEAGFKSVSADKISVSDLKIVDLVLFYFSLLLFSFFYLFLILGLAKENDVMSHVTIPTIKIRSYVTTLCNIKKNLEQ